MYSLRVSARDSCKRERQWRIVWVASYASYGDGSLCDRAATKQHEGSTVTTPQSQPNQPNDELNLTTSDARIQELLERMHEVADLGAIGALLGWDQNTALPDGAGEMRGAQMASFQGIVHERMTAARIGELLGELESVVAQAPYTDSDRGLVRQTRREYDQATKLPGGLVQEIARVGAAAFEAWRRARANDDFALFAPWLGKTITLQREVADRLGAQGQATRYDALLDLYEPGMTGERLDALFGPVREVSVATLQRIQQSGHTIDASCLEGNFPAESQVALSRELLTGMGYDFTRGAIAVSPHPFTTSFGSPFDVRVTVRLIRATSRRRLWRRFTRAATPSMSRGAMRDWRALRWRAGRRSARTSRSRVCGKTPSGALRRSGRASMTR